jgi:hypothetical protein
MPDLKDKLKSAAEEGVVDGAKGLASRLLSLWWLAPIAGIFVYFFRDAEWMPKGLVDFIQSIIDFFKEWIAKIPGVEKIPFLGEWVGKAAHNQLDNMTPEKLKERLSERFPPEVATTVANDKGAFDSFRSRNKNLNPLALDSKEGITALLLDADGRKVVGNMLTGFEAARKSGGSLASGGAATADQKKAQATLQAILKDVLKDADTFGKIWNNPDAKALMLRGASMASGVGFRGDGAAVLDKFLTDSKLDTDTQRTLFVGFMENPQKALNDIFTNKTIPTAALRALGQGIDASQSDEKLRAGIVKFQTLAANEQSFERARTVSRKLTPEETAALTNPDTRVKTLAALVTRQTDPFTGEEIAELMAASTDTSPIAKLLSNPTRAKNVISFIKAVGAEDFTTLAGSLAGAAAGSGQKASPFLDIFKDQNRTQALIAFHNTIGKDNFNQLASHIPQIPQSGVQIVELIERLTPPQQQSTIAFFKTLPDGDKLVENLETLRNLPPPQRAAAASIAAGLSPEATRSILAALPSKNQPIAFEHVVGLLMNDEIRGSLQGKEEALSTLLTSRVPQDMRPFVTPENLSVILKLADSIDNNTGGAKGSSVEHDADTRNARVIGLLVNLAQGKTALDGKNIDQVANDLAAVMKDQKHVEAFREFLNNFDSSALPEPKKKFFSTLKANWWNDVNRDSAFDARVKVSNLSLSMPGFQEPAYGDGGIAAFLANPEAAKILLEYVKGERITLFPSLREARSLGMAEIEISGLSIHPDLKALKDALPPVSRG